MDPTADPNFSPSTLESGSLLSEALSHMSRLRSNPTGGEDSDDGALSPSFTTLTIHSLTNAKDLHSFVLLLDEVKEHLNRSSVAFQWNDGMGSLGSRFKIQSTASRLSFTTSLYYGESLRDETQSLHFMLELSREFPTLAIQVQDSFDGEIILIESSDYIPSWITPDNSKNRVFVCNGFVHVVEPLDFDVSTQGNNLTICKALELISNEKVNTLASSFVQKSIDSKIKKTLAEENSHCAPFLLPLHLANLFTSHPNNITKALEAYYQFQSSQLQSHSQPQSQGQQPAVPVYSSASFIPSNSKFIITSLTVTRCVFAKVSTLPLPLNHTGFELNDIGSRLEQALHIKHLKGCREWGIMITEGLAIIAKKQKRGHGDRGDKDKEWLEITKNLKLGNSEGKLDEIKDKYISHLTSFDKSNSIEYLLSSPSSSSSKEKGKDKGKGKEEADYKIPISEDVDNEAWLNDMSLQEFDDKLKEVAGVDGDLKIPSGEKDKNEVGGGGDHKFTELASGLRGFFSRESGVSGVVADKNEESDDEDAYSDDDDNDDINIDEDKFMRILEDAIGVQGPVGGDDVLGEEREYGSDDSDSDDGDGDPKDDEETMKDVMRAMDLELKAPNASTDENGAADFDVDHDDEEDVNVDIGMVTNLIESMLSQDGSTGPAGNMIKHLGLDKHLPKPPAK